MIDLPLTTPDTTEEPATVVAPPIVTTTVSTTTTTEATTTTLASVSPEVYQTGQVHENQGQMDCISKKIPFDNKIHDKVYHIAVHAIRGFDTAYVEYNTTFAEYLTATAGQRFDPPILFEMKPYDFQGVFDAVENEYLDFFMANPGIFSCVGVETGAQPLVTTVSRLEVRGHSYDLDVYGGVMFARANNDAVNSIMDLKDKVIGAGGISMIMAAQLQFYEMEMAGLSYVMDPKQVVFTGNQYDVV